MRKRPAIGTIGFDVDYDRKDAFKALGGHWDPDKSEWYMHHHQRGFIDALEAFDVLPEYDTDRTKRLIIDEKARRRRWNAKHGKVYGKVAPKRKARRSHSVASGEGFQSTVVGFDNLTCPVDDTPPWV